MTIRLKTTDSRDLIQYTALTLDRKPFNLTGATSVRFLMANRKTGALITNNEAQIVDAERGVLEYQLTETDTLEKGVFHAEFQLDFEDGTRKTLPSEGYLLVSIEPNLDASQTSEIEERIIVRVSEIEEFKTAIDERVAQAEEAADKVNEFQAQINQMVIEGDSSVEAAQARVKADGSSYATLRERLNDSDAQLAHTGNKLQLENWELSSRARRQDGIAVFITDDGRTEDLTILKPIFDAAGVPYCIGAIPKEIMANPDYLDEAQLKAIENDGHEIMSHSMNHPNNPIMMNNPNDDEVEKEFSDSLKWFLERGFNVQNYVYPGGQYAKRERLFAKKYYRSARNSNPGFNEGINYPPFNQHELKTFWVDPMAGMVHDLVNQGLPMSEVHTLVMNKVKELVDNANEKGGLLIISTHSFMLRTQEEISLYSDVVHYVANNIPVKTMRDALNEMGNIVDIGDFSETEEKAPNDNHLVVGSNGLASGTLTVAKRNQFNATTPYREFPHGVTVVLIDDLSNVEGTPFGETGTLINYKVDNTYSRANFQEFHNIAGNTIARRRATPEGWENWDLVYGKERGNRYNYDLNTPFSELPSGITYRLITNSMSLEQNAPRDGQGVLISYIVQSPNTSLYNYQMYLHLESKNLYTRTSGGNWELQENITSFPQDNNYDHTTTLDNFRMGLTYSVITGSNPNISTVPEQRAGTLITHKMYKTGNHGYSFQEYHLFRRSAAYKRFANDGTTWGEWIKYIN